MQSTSTYDKPASIYDLINIRRIGSSKNENKRIFKTQGY